MNDMTNLVNEAMRRDGWFLVFVFVPVALVGMVLVADAAHERYNQLKSRLAVMHTGRHRVGGSKSGTGQVLASANQASISSCAKPMIILKAQAVQHCPVSLICEPSTGSFRN